MADVTSPHDLVDAGLFKDAATLIDGSRNVSREWRVLRARVEKHIGSPTRALASAKALLTEHLTHWEKATCWEIIGRVNLADGLVAEGLKAMTRALTEAAATKDPIFECRLLASHVQTLIGYIGLEPALIEMPRLRSAATRSGDPWSAVEFHLLSGEISAKRGLTTSAFDSLSAARGLLERYVCVSQFGRLETVSAGLEIIQSNYGAALEHARAALAHGRRTGSREILIPALNNLAYIRLAQAAFSDVASYLQELLSLIRQGGGTEVGVRDTEMMLALAVGDKAKATELAKRIAELSSDGDQLHTYYHAWHLPTRVKWLYQIGDVAGGVRLAIDSISRIEAGSDRGLIGRMYLLAAEGSNRLKDAENARSFLLRAVQATPEPSLELIAERYRVTGLLLARRDAKKARSAFDFASRILTHTGNLNAHRELIESWQAALSPGKTPGGEQPPEAIMEERSAGILALGDFPSLLADETNTLLADIRAAVAVSIETTGADGRQLKVKSTGKFSGTGRTIRVETGTHRGHKYAIVVEPKPDIHAQELVLRVCQLVAASVAASQLRESRREHPTFAEDRRSQPDLGIICSSEKTQELLATIKRVGNSNVTVLLTGESGVGKELFARALHMCSPRKDRPFSPFNVTATPRELLDSQLFGHKKGAFTGAIHDYPGLVKAASDGTLFLDEIGEMSLEAQPKLLRFLESGEILPLGHHKPETVDVRVVAATNANLEQLVADGKFREDLYYRLNVIRIHIPPLRERREEIPPLVDHFLERYSRELQKPMPRVADETLEYLVLYRWPGNVRQLANEIRRMVALAEPGAVLMPAHLSAEIAASRRTISTEKLPPSSIEVTTRIDQPLAAAVEHVERASIQRAMTICEGRVDDAAKLLGLSRKGLYLKRQRLKIEDGDLRRG